MQPPPNQYGQPNFSQPPNYQNIPGQVPGMYPNGVVPKSKTMAALLAFFLGGFGVHRFYLGYNQIGGVQLALTIVGIVTSCLGIGIFIAVGVGIWALVDMIMILNGNLGDARGVPLTS